MSLFRTLLIALAVAGFAFAPTSAAQTSPSKSSIYVEHRSLGEILSLNVERSFRQRVSLRLGAAYYESDILTIPASASYLFDVSKLVEGSRVELGLAAVYWPAGSGIRKLRDAAFVAAFRQPIRGGRWFYRASINSEQERLWPGLSIGRSL